MKKNHLIFVGIALTLLAISCKKEKNVAFTNTSISSDYGKLAVGNYWVYEKYQVDSLGNTIGMVPGLDSCYIESDTNINGHIYFKMYKPHIMPSRVYSYLRDSADCIVNSSGEILFSKNNFSAPINLSFIMLTPTDTLCSVTTEMQDNNILVTTGAGTFQTKNARQQYSFFPPWTSPIQTRNLNRRYSKDVGIVIDTREFFSGDYYLIEKRLIRYHVN